MGLWPITSGWATLGPLPQGGPYSLMGPNGGVAYQCAGAASSGAPPTAPQDGRSQRGSRPRLRASRERRNLCASRPEAPALRLQFAGFLFAFGVYWLFAGSLFLATWCFCYTVLWLAIIP